MRMDLARFCSSARVVIVAGKGGVGKTTVTATLATAAARAGASVLIVEVEGKSGLASCFAKPPLGYEETELAPGIRGRTLTPEETPVNELVDTAFALEDHIGVQLGPVVVNGCYPPFVGPAKARDVERLAA